MKKFFIAALAAVSISAATTLPVVNFDGKNGGKLDGSKWSSTQIKDKVHVLFYVDPDEKDLNEEASQALKKAKFPLDKYGSIAVINMAATWLPNFALESALKDKQKAYPDTLYLKDFKKVLVKKWKLKDDSSNIVLFNKKGENIMTIMGKASSDQIAQLISLIKKNL